MRRSRALRVGAWTLVAAGVAAPLLRKRVRAPRVVMQGIAFTAPVALAVATPRTRTRDVAIPALQMWAYLAAYKTPHDDAVGQARKVQIDYPIALDRLLGFGELPTLRLQRALAHPRPCASQGHGRRRWRPHDHVLVWTHWLWFAVPHCSLLYILLRHRERFDRAAVLTYAVFDLGASIYWFVPTAPPWYAATVEEQARVTGDRESALEQLASTVADPGRHSVSPANPGAIDELPVRRLMAEYGEDFWEGNWDALYSVFGGNPLAAMPSLHFATSTMAALLLAEAGLLPGALGWTYALTLGVALVYLGEHYVVDLIAGLALTLAVRASEPWAGPPLASAGRAIAMLQARASAA